MHINQFTVDKTLFGMYFKYPWGSLGFLGVKRRTPFELFSSARCNANHYKPYNSFQANITFIEFCTDWQFASKLRITQSLFRQLV